MLQFEAIPPKQEDRIKTLSLACVTRLHGVGAVVLTVMAACGDLETVLREG
jgi:hypothetical protein